MIQVASYGTAAVGTYVGAVMSSPDLQVDLMSLEMSIAAGDDFGAATDILSAGLVGLSLGNGSKVLSKLDELFGGTGETGKNLVYLSKNADDAGQYVGITNNYARRAADHLRTKGINIEPLMQNLTRSDARAVEQVLIEYHGLYKNGGTLINKINSISTSNPVYGESLERGLELLKSIGYLE